MHIHLPSTSFSSRPCSARFPEVRAAFFGAQGGVEKHIDATRPSPSGLGPFEADELHVSGLKLPHGALVRMLGVPPAHFGFGLQTCRETSLPPHAAGGLHSCELWAYSSA